MDWQHVAILALVGSIAGLLSGMLGVGGAVVIIPALVIVLGFSQSMAQGTTLMMMVLPVGALAAFQYYQKGFVDVNAALIMAVFFFVAGYVGAKFATQIPQEILKRGFSIMLVLIAAKMWFQK